MFSSPKLSVEEWAVNNSQRTTPDQIIAAAVVQSIANSPDDWIATGTWKRHYVVRYCYLEERNRAVLTNTNKGIKVAFGFRKVNRLARGVLNNEAYSEVSFQKTKVNDVEISPSCARAIYDAYQAMKAKLEAVKKAEKKALDSMNRNEAAWNLAETLLGMKRNEHGALVPVSREQVHTSVVEEA